MLTAPGCKALGQFPIMFMLLEMAQLMSSMSNTAPGKSDPPPSRVIAPLGICIFQILLLTQLELEALPSMLLERSMLSTLFPSLRTDQSFLWMGCKRSISRIVRPLLDCSVV
jgi:hypothetical protein